MQISCVPRPLFKFIFQAEFLCPQAVLIRILTHAIDIYAGEKSGAVDNTGNVSGARTSTRAI